MRPQVERLVALGPLPAEAEATAEHLQVVESQLHGVAPPITDAEAEALVSLFGPDDCFGLAWSLVHLIETAPSWPIRDCLSSNNTFVALLRERAEQGGSSASAA